MANLKGFAKHVQRELEKDETVERPSYNGRLRWCALTTPRLTTTRSGDTMKAITADIARLLVERIKPLARKVRKAMAVDAWIEQSEDVVTRLGDDEHEHDDDP